MTVGIPCPCRPHVRSRYHYEKGGRSRVRFNLVRGASRGAGRKRQPLPGDRRRDPGLIRHFSDPYIALARASAVTSTIKLATGITLVPERNPLLLAKEISVLDLHSGGRFIFGIGTGWLKEETELIRRQFRTPLDTDARSPRRHEAVLDAGRDGVSWGIFFPADPVFPETTAATAP